MFEIILNRKHSRDNNLIFSLKYYKVVGYFNPYSRMDETKFKEHLTLIKNIFSVKYYKTAITFFLFCNFLHKTLLR